MVKLLLVALATASLGLAQLAPGTTINATLSNEVESANAAVGDQVAAVTTAGLKQGKISLPKGTRFDGHVTAVTASTGNHAPGTVSVLFDRATTPKGVAIEVKAVLASAKMPAAAAPSPFSNGRRRGGFGRGGYGGGGYGGAPPAASAPVSHMPPAFRIPADAATQGGVVTQTDGDVWLSPKTKVTLQIVADAPAAPGGSAGGSRSLY